MDKKYGRSEQRFDADHRAGRKTDRQDREKQRYNRSDKNGWKPSAVKPKKKYPRPKPDRQFSSIDDYLKERDRKYGKTLPDDMANQEDENRVEGRNSVTEAFRSGRTVDHLYVQEGLNDGPVATIRRMAKKQGTNVSYVPKERLNAMSVTGHHQGVIATVASYNYSTVEDILAKAKEKGEDPFLIVLDGIEDPHNLGAIIRTANLAGAHGVIIGKRRAAGLTAAVVRASAGALNYTPVAKVTNLAATIDDLKKDGMWFVCADMHGTNMYDLEMKGAVGLVIGGEGSGVSRLIREKCDFNAKIPMRGDIDSLNASVAAGILAFEIARQRGI